MTDITALGYAVVENGKVNIRSVGPTWRSAAVNFLSTDRRWTAMTFNSDEDIETMWARLRRGAELKQVEIKVLV